LFPRGPDTRNLRFNSRIRQIDNNFIEINGWVLPKTDLKYKSET
jgi:hypothetical protein